MGEPEFAFPPDFGEAASGIILVRPPAKLLAELQAITDFFFCRPIADYLAMPDPEYRNLVLKAQSEMDSRRLAQQLASDSHSLLSRLLWCGHIAIQTLRLRAARPRRAEQVQEVISWHRESFYASAGAYMVNFWLPIANVNASTALQYVPNSHLIPDKDIKIEVRQDPRITMAQQHIGLLETVQHIVEGVDLSKAEPMVVLPGEAAIFHGSLIHGMGHNYSSKIRFSIDFRAYSTYNWQVAKEKARREKDNTTVYMGAA